MVLPFVPVMPTTRSSAVGSPWKRAAAGAIAARTSSTTTSGTPSPSGRWTTSAAAPRATASGAKSWPSRVKPGTQKNSVPGSTRAVVVGEAGDLDVVRAVAEQVAQRHRCRSLWTLLVVQPEREAPRGVLAHRSHLAGVGLGEVLGLRQRDAVSRRHDDRGGERRERQVGGAERVAAQVGAAVVEPRGDLVEHLAHAVARVARVSSSACVRRTIMLLTSGSITGSPARSHRGTPGVPYSSITSSWSSRRWYIHVRASGPRWWSKLASSAAASGLR